MIDIRIGWIKIGLQALLPATLYNREQEHHLTCIQEYARKLVTFSFCFLKISTIRNKATPKRPIDAPMTTSINGVDGDSINFYWTTNLICVRHRWVEHPTKPQHGWYPTRERMMVGLRCSYIVN
jgi:hypothetical protein